MARTKITYTQPGTVAHGYVIADGVAVYRSFDLEGSYLKSDSVENRVRKIYDRTFSLEDVTHYSKVYTMSVDDFIKHATLEDIREKE